MASLDEEQLNALADNWGAALNDEAIAATQTLSQLTDEAVACKSDSCAESEHRAGGTRLPTTSPSWAFRLAHMTKSSYPGKLSRPVNVISGCTGISAESFVLKARK